MFGLSHNAGLLLSTAVAVAGLLLLIARFKFNSFVALILASMFVGLTSGMKLADVAKSFQDGVGAVLGSIAVVVGLGTILGKLLAESGGAQVVARTFIDGWGEKRLPWTMMIVGFIVGIPVFFSVGLVLLFPILVTVVRRSKRRMLELGIPLVAGLSVVHGLVPPHPGPMVAIELLKADAGKTILYALLVGFPTAIIAGPLFGKYIARRVPAELTGSLADQLGQPNEHRRPPGFALTLFTILLPVILMLGASALDVTLGKENSWRQWGDFLGSPIVALLIALLFSLYSFGFARGFDRDQILKFTNDCLAPVATTLLVVGAGGGFNKVLVASGVGDAIAALARSSHVSPLLLGWFVAALIRVATGSATVAIATATGILAPIAAATPGVNLELLVLAMGAGSLILSHVNDGGFWFVKEYFNLSLPQMLKTWTVMETIIAIVALAFIMALSMVV